MLSKCFFLLVNKTRVRIPGSESTLRLTGAAATCAGEARPTAEANDRRLRGAGLGVGHLDGS